MNQRRLKVEQLERRLLLASDFGDAPEPYDTLAADGGAEHEAVGPTLGATRDTETDGAPSALADGDGADEDGVTFGTIQVGALDATVTVNVQGAVGKLDAWIDFNDDGSWGGPGEHIFASRDVGVGDNLLTFDVPSYAIGGTTYARFRLSTAGGLGVAGLAPDGEVEDYAVSIVSSTNVFGGFVGDRKISTTADGAYDVFAADLDGDGDLDLLSASLTDDKIAWYENDGNQNFTEHTITTTADGAVGVYAADFDGDGDMDVFSASFNDDTIAWYINDGSQQFTKRTISPIADGAYDVLATDVDSDGDMDVLSASGIDDSIVWYENDGRQQFARRVISNTANYAVSVYAADVDGDGDLDVLSASILDGTIAWFENDGNENFTEHTVSNRLGRARSVYAADVDGDGDMDVLSASEISGRITWFENDGSQNFTEHTISTTVDLAKDVFAADVDGDGDLDVLSASREDDTIAWYENDGSQNFTERTISNSTDGAFSVFVADVDGDGDLDVLSASLYDDTIAWHENVSHFYDFSVPTFNAIEGDTTNTTSVVRLVRSGATDVASSVDVVLVGDSATSGLDFTAGPITVDFAAGETTKSVPIEILGETLAEANETIALSMANFSSNSRAGTTRPTAVLHIQSDDPADFGDAPTPYPTTREENGPEHATDGPLLGSTRDLEPNGTHSPAADADGADEDGVTFGTVQVGALDTTVTVNVQGTPAKLDAWIDFNGDGSWGGLGERVFASRDLVVGDNLLTFDIPSYAVAGTTYARFRLSTAGGLGYVGFAADGEVEDYEVEILPVNPIPATYIIDHVIATPSSAGYALHPVDMDNDGDLDILTSRSGFSSAISWYENNGSQEFATRFVTTSRGANTAFGSDFDQDGDIDVVTMGRWYENDGLMEFTEHSFPGFASAPSSFEVADFDGDGDYDFVSTFEDGDKISWHENDGAQSFVERVVSTSVEGPDNVNVIDFDRDGDLDLVVSASGSDQIVLLDNDGNNSFTERVLAGTAYDIESLDVGDIDGDGDRDVLAAVFAGDSLTWYENTQSASYIEHVITSDADGANVAKLADADGDGDIDLLLASSNDDTVAWYENDGSQAFVEHVLTTSADRPVAAEFADLDSDGDLDFVTVSLLDDVYRWYENALFTVSVGSDVSSVLEDSGDSVTITFSRSGVTSVPATIDFDVVASAEFGVDYLQSGANSFDGTSGTVSFAADEITTSFTLTAIADDDFEPTELITVQIRDNNSNHILSNEASVTVELLSESSDSIADFGDAPSPYATTSPNKAGHAPIGPTLGVLRDIEPDGQPTIGADGDGADDDGVVFGFMTVGQLDAWAAVNLQNAAQGAMLDAWIDFNQDGSWSSTEERIAAGLPLVEGDNTFEFDVPADALAGPTYARFRVSTDGGLGPFGAATDGEVEDYRIEVIPSDPAIGVAPNEIIVNSPISKGVDYIDSVDLDGDGDLDLLSTSYDGNLLAWYENDGAQQFTYHPTASIDRPTSVASVDLDQDGDLDLITASSGKSRVDWYENDGDENFSHHILIENTWGARSIHAADIDGDGDVDLFAALGSTDDVVWLENDGTQNFSRQVIDGDFDSAYSVSVYDIDRDGDADILASAFNDRSVVWYENDGSQSFTKNTINTSTSSVRTVVAGDIDGDGDVDVLSAESNLVWYENMGSENFAQRIIPTSNTSTRDVSLSDIDGDGDLDILGAFGYEGYVAWYENLGELSFAEHVLSAYSRSADVDFLNVIPGDLDSDGDIDVIAAYERGYPYPGTITWFETVSNDFQISADTTELVEDSGVRATLTFERLPTLLEEQTVFFSIAGTAVEGTDFHVAGAASWNSNQGSITFLDGERTAELILTALPDSVAELDKMLSIYAILPSEVGLPEVVSNPFAVEITLVDDEPVDFGDAPDTYQTTEASGGALHGNTGPSLGALRDAESDGQPAANADGDGADDDGVTLHSARVGQLDAELTVNVQNAPSGARLDAWFDFDGDGNWHGAWDQVATNVEVVEGDNTVLIDIPAWAQSGPVYARFRVSTDGTSGPMGFAVDGEVEDYLFEISPPSAGRTFSVRDPIDSEALGVQSVSPIDLDRDGDLDIVSVWSSGRAVTWYENTGDESFTKHEIDITNGSALSLLTLDVDRDGDIDILVGTSSFSEDLLLYENDGAQTFFKHVIDTSLYSVESLSAGDLDRDGDIDLTVSGSLSLSSGGGVSWLEYQAPRVYQEHQLTIDRLRRPFDPIAHALADFNGDGTIDIVAQEQSGPSPLGSLHLFANDGQAQFTPQVIVYFPYFEELSAVDIDSDGDQDVLMTYWNGFSALINDGTGQFTLNYQLDNSTSLATSFPVDLDGDGDIDVLTSSSSDESIFWRENTGNFDEDLPEHVIAFGFPLSRSVAAGDIDGDGDIDVIGTSDSGNLVSWFENIEEDAGDFDSNGIVDGFDFLAWQRGFGSTDADPTDGDADGDGDVDSVDLSDWQATHGYTKPPEPLPGDFNEDGSVDGFDFLQWQRGFGTAYDDSHLDEWESNYGPKTPPESIPGDFNEDGFVTGLDFLQWQQGAGTVYDGDDLVDWEANYGLATVEPSPEGLATSDVAESIESDTVVVTAAARVEADGTFGELTSAAVIEPVVPSSLSKLNLIDLAMAARLNGSSRKPEAWPTRSSWNAIAIEKFIEVSAGKSEYFRIASADEREADYLYSVSLSAERSSQDEDHWEDQLDEAIEAIFS